MEYHATVEPDTGWGSVTISGDIYLNEFPRVLSELWAHPDYVQAKYSIWDFSAGNTTLHFSDVMELTNYIVQNKRQRGPTTIAIVAPRDLEYGVGRVFAALEEKCGFTVSVFRTAEQARAWLTGLETNSRCL